MAVEEVEGNEGLLISILIWLPPISVFKFRCVSKRWKTIIADRFFLQSYHANTRNRQLCYGGERILAFIQETYCSRGSYSPPNADMNILHMNILPVAQADELHIMQIPREFGEFISSSNGLILCNVEGRNSFQVVNPLTRTWVMVPVPSHIMMNTARFGFACEEHTYESIPSFRIVGLELNGVLSEVHNTVLIETYSSKTDKWTTSTVIGAELLDVNAFEEPYVSNCVFHYRRENGTLAVYDPSEDENHLQLIELPQHDEFKFTLTRSSNDDVLWVGANADNIMMFWKLPRDEHGGYKRTATIARNEWILMHTIDTQSLYNDATLLLGNKKRKKRLKRDGGTVDDKVSYFDFEAFTPWNPMSVVLSHEQRVFRYNLESKIIELIPYRGVPLADSFYMHPYFESLSLSSYALIGNTYG